MRHFSSLTKIIMDPRTVLKMGVVILDATGTIVPPKHGESLSITIPDGTVIIFMTEDATVDHVHGATKVNLDLIKEDSITYPAPA